MFSLEISASFAIKAIAVGLLQYSILRAIYNLFFHPLKNFPGPRMLAASQLPTTYAKITGQFPFWALHLHEKYGSVVRVAPGELSYSDSASWRDIYASHPTRPSGMPRNLAFYKAIEGENGGLSLLTASNRDRKRVRRAYSKAFSKQAVAAKEPLITRHISVLLKALNERQRQHQSVNIVDMITFLIADITFDIQLGESLHLFDDITHHPWVLGQVSFTKSAQILSCLTEYPLLKAFFQLVLPQLARRAQRSYFGWINTKLSQRLTSRSGKKRPDTVHFVMEQDSPDATITETELRVNTPLVIFAQSETTSSVLSGLIGHLLDTPYILSQLQDEVRSTFGTRSEINMAEMTEMKLLNACIKEALRIYPGLPSESPRVVPESGAMISGRWVPGGTQVYTSILATFHSSENFHDPETFLPQRWYKEIDEFSRFSKDDKSAWKPFSVGTRDCIGQHLADSMMLWVICELMLHFDFEPCTDTRAWFCDQKIWSVWSKPPLMVRLTPVKALS